MSSYRILWQKNEIPIVLELFLSEFQFLEPDTSRKLENSVQFLGFSVENNENMEYIPEIGG